MARHTFFSFRYKADNWRAASIRNSWLTQNRKASGFFDTAKWEEVKKKKDADIEKWISEQMKGTSVTVVLIGSDTVGKKWIDYEITESHKKGNGMLGIYIHKKKDSRGNTSAKGKNPFDKWTFKSAGKTITYPTYDWIDDDGYNNMGSWIEKAAKAAGR
ncbi:MULTISPECIES: TIR domain-containing protein [unclassified Alteromonas]|uniref:TIR domain-containing protein n=1 Tax=unclassified Alteromonas TaxID=2614992 RepID=UPI0005095E7F|nr:MULTISPECIES: TIR domain-containing protein [unclassified Alteromonas]